MLDRIRAEEREAFGTFVEENWLDVVEYLTPILAEREAAEDACQEAFLRLWEGRAHWHDGSARGLVFRIGRNLAFDVRRRDAARRRWAAWDANEGLHGAAPDEVVEQSELELRFRAALAELTPGRRQAVEVVRLRGLTHQEASVELGIARQTVANRLTLALADLRLLLVDAISDEVGRSGRLG